jgi:tRNA-Thr(GGU) m(6)t(6)A37 methyltransferase TsaA
MADMEIIARIRSPFAEKFGIPRQSGVVEELQATVVFEPAFRNPDAVRGLEGFSHIWLIWQFSRAVRHTWSPTVRPPRLGGNERMGVFATRSPFRPNAIGLSSVRLERIEFDRELGPVLHVSGADLMDGTPIFDIKPYLPATECIPDADKGIGRLRHVETLDVEIPDEGVKKLPEGKSEALRRILELDPRPGYQDDPSRIYGFPFAGREVKFRVEEGKAIVVSIE